jgi:hypothetical protein
MYLGSGVGCRCERGGSRGPPAAVPLRPDLKQRKRQKSVPRPAYELAIVALSASANNPTKAVEGSYLRSNTRFRRLPRLVEQAAVESHVSKAAKRGAPGYREKPGLRRADGRGRPSLHPHLAFNRSRSSLGRSRIAGRSVCSGAPATGPNSLGRCANSRAL